LQRYREIEGEWLVLKGLEDDIAQTAGMEKDSVFYDIEIIPSVKKEDFESKIFFDEIDGIPKSLFELAPHLNIIYGGDLYDGYSKSEHFNESVSDIVVCFPFDAIAEDIKSLQTKNGPDLEAGIKELYIKKLKPLVEGFFSKILKVTESKPNFFEKNSDYFNKMEKKCVKYLTDLTHQC